MKPFRSLEDVVRVGGAPGLGEGAFARVNLVHHRAAPETLYAMKEVHKRSPKLIELIQREIRLHRALSHPHVIAFVDCLETPDRYYIFLEYASQGDMFAHLRRARPSTEECYRLFYQTCEGIRYIHAKNVMHRDLKPENILLDAQLNVKIADFGWSAVYSPEENRQTLCGTMEYMAPEVFLRKKQTKKTDVWSLGILLYELFHGHAPFRGNKPEEFLQQISKNCIAFRKDIDRCVRDLILKILSFEPAKRPTVEEIIAHEALQTFLARQRNQSPIGENALKKALFLPNTRPATTPSPAVLKYQPSSKSAKNTPKKENISVPNLFALINACKGTPSSSKFGTIASQNAFMPAKISGQAKAAPQTASMSAMKFVPASPIRPNSAASPKPHSFANYLRSANAIPPSPLASPRLRL